MTYGDVKKVCSFRLGTETLKHLDTIVATDKPGRWWGPLTKTEAIERALKHYAEHVSRNAPKETAP